MSKIKISLNGQDYNLDKSKTILDLVTELDLDLTKIAVEKNYEIILTDNFGRNNLCEGDKIEIVHFIGGG